MELKRNMTVANLLLAIKIVGFLLWVAIFLVVSLVLYFLWEEFNGKKSKSGVVLYEKKL
jgi:tryptophan-rich sensory protein